jgi:hypothetical protein
MPKNAYSQSYRKMSELSSPPITLAVLGLCKKLLVLLLALKKAFYVPHLYISVWHHKIRFEFSTASPGAIFDRRRRRWPINLCPN